MISIFFVIIFDIKNFIKKNISRIFTFSKKGKVYTFFTYELLKFFLFFNTLSITKHFLCFFNIKFFKKNFLKKKIIEAKII